MGASRYTIDKEFALEMDRRDPLARFKERFYVPKGKIYLDGNSLGLASKDAEASSLRALGEWKNLGIDGWLNGEPPWFYYAETVGAKAAELVGAKPEEVVATGTTTLNIHSLLATFYEPEEGGRRKILADELTFPTDLYALQGQIEMRGLNPPKHLILTGSDDGRTLDERKIISLMGDDVCVVFLPSVLYRSAQLLDMELLTREAHARGIAIGFDCAHSVGAVPHELSAWGVDFAVWCSYKYLNAGPGSTAFLYLNERHFDKRPRLKGWFGYEKSRQFDLLVDFESQKSAGGWQVSSPGILGIAACEGALGVILEAGIDKIREKSIDLTSYLIFLVDELLGEAPYSFIVGSPRDAGKRSGHVAIEREESAFEVGQALKEMGIVGDFRPPRTIRLAPVALYNSYLDVWTVVDCLKKIIDSGSYKNFSSNRGAVT